MRDFENDFEEWLRPDGINGDYRFGQALSANFKDLPFSMQWGVYVDFFIEKGIIIFNQPERSGEWSFFINDKCVINENHREARKAALEKAKEIYNNKI